MTQMQTIIENLLNPAWWFNGLFFLLIGLALPACFKRSGGVPKRLVRRSVARSRKKMRLARQDALMVTGALIRADAYFVAFLLSGLGYLALLYLVSLSNGGKVPWSVVGWAAPVFVLELAWIFKTESAQQLVAEHAKLKRRREILRAGRRAFPG